MVSPAKLFTFTVHALGFGVGVGVGVGLPLHTSDDDALKRKSRDGGVFEMVQEVGCTGFVGSHETLMEKDLPESPPEYEITYGAPGPAGSLIRCWLDIARRIWPVPELYS